MVVKVVAAAAAAVIACSVALVAASTAAASHVVRCTLGSFPNVSMLDVSPDGTEALVARLRSGGLQVTLVTLATGRRRALFTAVGRLPARPWSPDGRTIAFVLNGDTFATISVASGRVRPVYSPLTPFAFDSWSPDGTQVVLDVGGTLRLVSADIGAWRDLVAGRGGSFSPSGSSIAYYGTDGYVHTIAVSGADDTAVAPYGLAVQSPITWAQSGNAIAWDQRNGAGPAQLVLAYGGYRIEEHAVSFQAPLWWRNRLVWTDPGWAIVLDPAVATTSETGFRRLHPAPGASVQGWAVIESSDRIVYRETRNGVSGFRIVDVHGRGDHQLVACRGGPAPERIVGTADGDFINSRYGERDVVDCGDGVDTVIADRTDRVARDCEHVWRR